MTGETRTTRTRRPRHGAQAVADPDGAPGAWLRRHQWAFDALLTAAVFAYNLPVQAGYLPADLPSGAWLLLPLGLCAPYLLRRRYPLPVFGAVLLAAWVQTALGVGPLAADVMAAFALYNVAVRFRWPVSVPAAGAVVLWLLVSLGPRLDEYHLSIGDLGLLLLAAVWAWTWGTLVRVRGEHTAGLRERALQLEREKEARARIAAAAERARIAREIHDVVSHGLSAVVLLSEGAALKVRSEPERAEQAMLAVRDAGRGALAEMRRMLDVLRSGEPGPDAPPPGAARIEHLVEEARASGLPVRLTTAGEPAEEPPAGLALAVYRVVQEALTNARRHAGPRLSRVDVELRHRPGEVEVRVADDGRGADAARDGTDSADGVDGAGGGTGGGHGLAGMRERVAAHNGRFRAGPRPGGGFEVVAVLPTGGKK
ncbi:sensor histidine kinase [Nocardiopsis potens]|uniref:sensor histidine kinase n=1 Tax=Nocardiopsis potens TaxID=1246458 RepID=UPI00037176BE|nr:histidine kinase [Nocardiopsis potens]